MMVMVQGRRYLAAGIAFFEVTIFVIAIGKVVGHLDNPLNIIGYSGGFSAGTILGIVIEGRLALGSRVVRIITHRENNELLAALRDAGFGVTRIEGEGKDGKVYILFSVVRRRNLENYLDIVDKLAPKAFVTIEEARETRRGFIPVSARIPMLRK